MTRARLLLLAIVGLLVLTGCSDTASGVFEHIGMKDAFYTRDVTRVAAGDTVKFENSGQDLHNAVAIRLDDLPLDGPVDPSEVAWSTGQSTGGTYGDLLEPGQSASVTVDQPGVYLFYCTLHGSLGVDENGNPTPLGMGGVLVVGDVDYSAAGAKAPSEPVDTWTGVTRSVPDDYPTIQNAVDAADPGDLVLVGPAPEDDAHRGADGRYVYKEEVEVTTPYLTIRGTDRNDVIVDGEFQRPNAIKIFAADGVAVENLTVRNGTENGLFWTGLKGYRASYVTAYDNGVYGIYAFDSTDGLFEHSYASGSPDAGFYIGQCQNCRAVVRDIVAERNALGYSGTNASGLYLIESEWKDNVVGIAPNTLDSELLPPFEGVTIVGNLVHDNGNRDAPVLDIEWPSFGNGIMLAGGLDSVVARNRVWGQARSGIFVTPNLSQNFWMTGGNEIRDNVVEDSGYADITQSGPALGGNCYADNELTTTAPAGLQSFQGCDGGLRLPLRYDVSSTFSSVGLAAESGLGWKPQVDYRTLAPPPAQESMPGGATAEVVPAVDPFAPFASPDDPNVMDPAQLAAIELPPAPANADATVTDAVTVWGVPLNFGFLSAYFGVVGLLIPALLLAVLMLLAFVDLARRDDLSPAAGAGWGMAVLAVPFLGAIAYHTVGGATVPRRLRTTMLAVGIGGWLVLLVLGLVLGKVV